MATKRQLYEKLAELQAENHRLKAENESFRSELMRIYLGTRRVLGVEAAAQEREDARLKAQGTN